MVELNVMKRGGFGWFGGEVAFLQTRGPLDIAVLFTLGALDASVGGDDEFGGKCGDLVHEAVESDARDLDFEDSATDMLELALVVKGLHGRDRGHAGLETAGSIGIRSSKEFEKVRQLGVRL